MIRQGGSGRLTAAAELTLRSPAPLRSPASPRTSLIGSEPPENGQTDFLKFLARLLPGLPRQASTDQLESADRTDPTLAAEATENTDAMEPTEPIDRIEPAEPIDKMDPAEPIDRIEPLEPMLRMDPPVFRIGPFSQGPGPAEEKAWLVLEP